MLASVSGSPLPVHTPFGQSYAHEDTPLQLLDFNAVSCSLSP